MKYFPLIKGNSSLGKHVLVQEVARMLAQNLIDRPITPLTGSERVIQFLKGAAYSGAWLCCSTIDRLREDHMSALVSTVWKNEKFTLTEKNFVKPTI